MAKTRVHELAKEFGVESKFVLEKLKEMGEFVKSPSSTIELPVEMRFKKEYGEKLKAAAEAAARPPPEAPAEAGPQARREEGRAGERAGDACAGGAGRGARPTGPGPAPIDAAEPTEPEPPAAPEAPSGAPDGTGARPPGPRPAPGRPDPGNNPFASGPGHGSSSRRARRSRGRHAGCLGRPPPATAVPRVAPACRAPTRR